LSDFQPAELSDFGPALTVVTLESIERGNVRATGVFAVTLPGSVWKARPAFGDLEQEIEDAIRVVLQRHAEPSADDR
jgi:hypothetical protein